MALTKIDEADYTAGRSQDYNYSAAYNNTSYYTDTWTVEYLDTEGGTGQSKKYYQCPWSRWHGYYRVIPELTMIIDKKAQWVVGEGYDWIKGSARIKANVEAMNGIGKDNFLSILHNAVRTYTICGDFYAEKIKDKQGRLINLKPMNPGSVRIVIDAFGRITGYEQVAQISGKQLKIPFDKDDIFHISWNRIADECHGISTIQKLEKTIEAYQESFQDVRVVFHRYVKPLLITEVDTDDETEIAAFKVKIDTACSKGENMIIPKGVANVERVSIPQYSTLDPLPWQNSLIKKFLLAEGVPSIVLGHSSEEDTEASAKIVYIGFEHMVQFNQRFLEEQIKSQLGFEIKFRFTKSLIDEMKKDQSKDGGAGSNMETDPAKKTN